MKTASLVSALPLCCLFLAAANQNDCTIHIVTENGEGEGEGSGEGEGEGGDNGECNADSDCAAGQICAFVTTCPPCSDQDPSCAAPCEVKGVCVDEQPPPAACQSDDECGAGFFCDFSQCGARPDGSNDIACNGGVCSEIPPPPPGCQADSDCEAGTHCEVVCGGPNSGSDLARLPQGQGGDDDPCAAPLGPGPPCGDPGRR